LLKLSNYINMINFFIIWWTIIWEHFVMTHLQIGKFSLFHFINCIAQSTILLKDKFNVSSKIRVNKNSILQSLLFFAEAGFVKIKLNNIINTNPKYLFNFLVLLPQLLTWGQPFRNLLEFRILISKRKI
jgi:hypothetical protein